MSRPRIVCTGMCNTKGVEIRHLADAVAAHGGEPIIMDLSLGAAVDWADVSLTEVLAATGTSVDEVFDAPRSSAIELVGRAGAAKILELRAEGRCDGIISWAGSVGTTTATRVMRALPFGVPKVMLTDQASADVSAWLGTKDVWISSPTAEQGINVVTRRAVANAAAAVVAMAREPDVAAGTRPLSAITSYGSTTPTVLRCRDVMEARGWDVAVFHAVGAGATMEDLVRSGVITAMLDLTTAELGNTLCGSVYGMSKLWEGERLTAAGELGIPQVVAPGGLDQFAFGPLASVPQRYLDDIAAGRRRSHLDSCRPYQHNDGVTIVSPTLDEIDRLGEEIARKLCRSTGPTAFLLPMRGWSAYDQPEGVATRERGWAKGNGPGPTWEPDPERPEWSRRSRRLLEALRRGLDDAPDNVDLLALDLHILDESFADIAIRCMTDMLDGCWRAGLYRDVAPVA